MKGALTVEDKQSVAPQGAEPDKNAVEEFEQHVYDRFTKIV